jgi:hypothetical protein
MKLSLFIITVLLLHTIKSDLRYLENEKTRPLRDGKFRCDPKDPNRINTVNQYIEKNKNKLSSEEINMIYHIAGDCLPVVWLSGLYGNKMQLQITDCDLLRKHHPSIAQACGYDKKCKNNQEALFWLTEEFETRNGSTCFGEILKINYIKQGEEYVEQEHKGLRLTFYGNTPETRDKSECGFGASCFLLDKNFYFGKQAIYGAKYIKEHLLELGYQIGYNLFSVPLDWRRTTKDPHNQTLLKDAVDVAYKINNKPVILMAHSYGNLVSVDYLYTLSPEEKKQKIARLMSIGAPYLGSSKIVKPLILGNDEFNIYVKLVINLYVSMENQKIFQNGSPAVFHVMPRMFWIIHKEQDWFKAILTRARIENKITECVRRLIDPNMSFKDEPDFLKDTTKKQKEKHLKSDNKEDEQILDRCIYPIIDKHVKELREFKQLVPFFPDLEYGCGNEGTSDATCLKISSCKTSVWDKYCRLNFFIPFDDSIFEVKHEGKIHKYDMLSYENTRELIKKFGIGDMDLDFFDYITNNINSHMEILDHPGVPVTIYYLSSARTIVKTKLDQNPKNLTDKNKFIPEELGLDIYDHYGGDGTVPSSSLLLPPLKWSISKESKENPIHFVEYCSNTTYKRQDINFSSNQYLNVDCQCKTPSDDSCSHASFVTDKVLINHFDNYVNNVQNKISDKKLLESIDIIGRGVGRGMNCANLNKLFK